MTEDQNTAYVQAQTTCAMVEAMGMFSDNMHRLQRGETIAYPGESFFALINSYGIHHNAVMTAFTGSPGHGF